MTTLLRVIITHTHTKHFIRANKGTNTRNLRETLLFSFVVSEKYKTTRKFKKKKKIVHLKLNQIETKANNILNLTYFYQIQVIV